MLTWATTFDLKKYVFETINTLLLFKFEFNGHQTINCYADSIDTRRAMLAIRELINASNQVECAQPLVSSSAHLAARAYQSYAVAAFILRLLQVFGASDRTALSDAWGSFSHMSSNGASDITMPISSDFVMKAANKPLYVSMDIPRKETFAAAFHGAAIACRNFIGDLRKVAAEG